MSYIESNLLNNEKLVYRGYIHWIIFSNPVLLFLLVMVLINLAKDFFFYEFVEFKYILMLPFLYVLYIVIQAIITYTNTEFGVTNMRIIVKRGFITYTTSENFLTKVEDIRVYQSILGRILGYGTITIFGTGGQAENFQYIVDPLTFRKNVQEQVQWALTNVNKSD
ncbi:MAG: PH domain-containing protein [Gammaproteobacteria bacterium]